MLRNLVAVAVCGLLIAACADDSTNTNPMADGIETQSVDIDGCTFEKFQLEITQGPSAGLMVEGKLLLAKDAKTAGALTGGFLANGKQISVTGEYTDSNVALHVDLGDGRFVEGYGPVTGGNYCAVLTGIALGPTSAADNSDPTKYDQGHWLTATPTYLDPYPTLVLADPYSALAGTEVPPTASISAACRDKAKAACACCSVAGTNSCRVKAGDNCEAGQMGNIAQDSAGNMFAECTASGTIEAIQQIGCKLGIFAPLKE